MRSGAFVAKILLLGSTGCQPVAFGRRAECTFAQRAKSRWRVPHSVNPNLFAEAAAELQASSLCSPEVTLQSGL